MSKIAKKQRENFTSNQYFQWNLLNSKYILQKIVASKFRLKLTTLTFWTKVSQKRAFLIENKKNCKYWKRGPNLPKNGVSIRKQRTEQHHWVQHIRISLGTKFYLQLITLIFFHQIVPNKGISNQKWKKWTSLLNSAYLN